MHLHSLTRHSLRLTPLALAAAAALGQLPTAHAIEIDVGNPDVAVRWDNSVRYNLGTRVQAQDSHLLANPNLDDGNRNFGQGAVVANRFDLLSELDVVVNKKYGFRLSGAAWNDSAYNSLSGTNTATANTLSGGSGEPAPGTLSDYASRYAKGPSGEILDAFVFANTEIGDVPLNIKAGRHTVFWGESLLGGGAMHGVSYGQYSLDLWKALATPGIEAKELFRPRNSVTLQIQPTTDLTLSAQTFLEWESARYPESGTYLTVNDALLKGGNSLIAGPGLRLLQGAVGEPKQTGDWGLSARWSPEKLEGTLGIYARRTADIQPQLVVTPAAGALPAGVCPAIGAVTLPTGACYFNPAAATPAQLGRGQVGQYQAFYGRDIDIFGLSLSKSVAGISVGAELSVRRNMPLQSNVVTVLPGPLVTTASRAAGTISVADLAALGGDTPGARGNTAHGVLSLIGTLPKNGWFDAATWMTELSWNRWLSVTQNAGAFKGSEAYAANPANVDAVTRDFLGLGINFTPTWFQVFPSVDVSMPLSWSGGISGNSAVLSGGNHGAGSYSIGVAADIQSKYNIALRYVGFYGDYTGNAANVTNGTNAVLSDRGHIMLTVKATF